MSAHAPAQIRINGACVPINSQILPPDAPLELLREVVDPLRMGELERTGELNMAVAIEGVGNFRINSAMRQRGTYAVVVRYIANIIPALDELNLPEVLKSLIMDKRGLILMVGATGAGKTTTLASRSTTATRTPRPHPDGGRADRVRLREQDMSLINQRDVGSDTQSLSAALKNALRQAPDAIQIGEIRDRETMTAAIAYAQSGHLCLATLHANNAYRALNRILSFYLVEVMPYPARRPGRRAARRGGAAPVAHPARFAPARRRGDAEHRARGRPDREGRLPRASRKR